MTVIDGEIVIERLVEDVFDYVADERNEPQFNSRMSRVELVTPEPIGAGSRFLAESRMMGGTFEVVVEYTVFERPRAPRIEVALDTPRPQGPFPHD